ncbi:MAG TPA: hypothetical protein VGM59_06755 [Dongiaceae bacterium]
MVGALAEDAAWASTDAMDCAWSCDERNALIETCCARCAALIWAAAWPAAAISMAGKCPC